jgi:SAM-dependent methyltransferase
MLADPSRATASHQRELPVRPGYSRWKERVVLRSLTDAQIALDIGAGRQQLDDPCIIKMDLVLDPLLDLVGDVQALPFKADSLDFVFGGAMMEHLPRPRQAIDEMYRVLKPGGYVYADWNFLAAYHGYPHHYFNATMNGVQEAFCKFTEIQCGVAPFQGSAFALRSLLGTYLEIFRPVEPLEREFVDLLHRVLWYPLDDFENRISAADRYRVAAGVYFFGVKQPNGTDHLIPEPVVSFYRSSADLRERFPNMLDLSVPSNIMIWAKRHGAHEHPSLSGYFKELPTFSKRGHPHVEPRPIDAFPAELMERVDAGSDDGARRYSLFFSRPMRSRLRDSWVQDGVAGVASCLWKSMKHRGKIIWQSFRISTARR